MIEHWKPIEGFEGKYEVSSLGRIRSLDRTIICSNGSKRHHTGRILQPTIAKGGYNRYCLSINRTQHVMVGVHHEMAKAFLENTDPQHKTQVNHIDGNPSNNDLTNLEWCTPKENVEHAWRTGLCTPNCHGTNKLSDDDVSVIRKELSNKLSTTHDLAERFHVSNSTIECAARGIKYKHVSEPTISKRDAGVPKKLTDTEVAECRIRARNGESINHLAIEFGISQSKMSEAVNGTSYKHVGVEPFRQRNCLNRLTSDDVTEIRKHVTCMSDIRQMALKLGVSPECIYNAAVGRSFKNNETPYVKFK